MVKAKQHVQVLRAYSKVEDGDSSDSGDSGILEAEYPPTPSLTMANVNPCILNFKAMEYAARGPVIQRAFQIENELKNGVSKPFTRVIKANMGDAHAMGQKPITFLRQVVAAVSCPTFLQDNIFSEEIKERARNVLNQCRGGSIGSYSDSRGMELIREHVAQYLKNRDGGVEASKENILLTAGASEGIRACLKLFKSGSGGKKSGVMVPVPQYPLYNATLSEYDMIPMDYYLDENRGWAIDVQELERSYKSYKDSSTPRAIVVINPGNPTGHVLTRENMEAIIKFAHRRNLVILADEVYQDNVYGPKKFNSFKKVLKSMGEPYSSLELMSFFSTSKGFVSECGLRGGFCEVVNLDQGVKSLLEASVAAKLCPTVLGQVAVDCVVSPPQFNTPEYSQFLEEKTQILTQLEEKAKLVTETFKRLRGIESAPIEGAMYAYPKVLLPRRAIEEAEKLGMEPDVFYCLDLLEKTGICLIPGSGIGQKPNTYHFRTTILPQMEQMKEMLQMFSKFHLNFLNQYES